MIDLIAVADADGVDSVVGNVVEVIAKQGRKSGFVDIGIAAHEGKIVDGCQLLTDSAA